MSSSAGMLIIYVVAFIGIFYFMAIRPQQKQRKAHAALLSSLKKGDQIMTASGIYGKVKRVEESLVVVEIARGVTIKIARNAVTQIIRDKEEARAAAPDPKGKNAVAEIEEAEEAIESEVIEEEIVDEAAAEEDAEASRREE